MERMDEKEMGGKQTGRGKVILGRKKQGGRRKERRMDV